ncbi:MAG TPA: AraC family transcriptional regulator ligand-binding domain-containing protein, partial [Hyphomicrobium sp.]|nr:AraC family transcriptional regulator ligand-binding domain-containing protein [Hyphomicrobium sp.]
MPSDLLHEPDKLLLLRDQVRLLACAVDELGDPALPAKLSTNVGAAGLGPLGRRVCASDTLGEAIARAEAETPQLLQTSTWTGLAKIDEKSVLYGYQITERIDIGRQTNEV